MNQVFLRSVNTSIVSVLPVLSTLIVGSFILGAVTLQEFAIALTVGLTIGAYSSVFVAAPVVVWMKEREPRNRQLRDRLNQTKARAATTIGPDGEAIETDVVPAGVGGVATRVPITTSDPANFSKNHPPRPRKQGKKR